ncbi:glycosyltransferase family 2 protein [Methyloparacoccus murrellii]
MNNKNTPEYPLVSVLVITYNSSKYVLETLESIKRQTYSNIELVISDDASSDDTVEICQSWLALNADHFVRARLVCAEQNAGIPANCNQALGQAQGEWVKFIAGDDILLPECISIFLHHANASPAIRCFVGQMYTMQGNTIKKILMPVERLFPPSAKKQLRNLILFGSLPAPAAFYSLDMLISVGGFDQTYPGVEDYPLYVKIFACGYYFGVIQRPVVIYRVHGESITQRSDTLFSRSMLAHFNNVVYPTAKREGYYIFMWHLFLNEKLGVELGRKKLVYSWLTRLTDIFYWRRKVYPFIGRDIHSLVSFKVLGGVEKSDLL